MKNVTITLPDEVAKGARVAAAEAEMSLSRWIGGLVQLELGDRPNGATMRDVLYRGDWPKVARNRSVGSKSK